MAIMMMVMMRIDLSDVWSTKKKKMMNKQRNIERGKKQLVWGVSAQGFDRFRAITVKTNQGLRLKSDFLSFSVEAYEKSMWHRFVL